MCYGGVCLFMDLMRSDLDCDRLETSCSGHSMIPSYRASRDWQSYVCRSDMQAFGIARDRTCVLPHKCGT